MLRSRILASRILRKEDEPDLPIGFKVVVSLKIFEPGTLNNFTEVQTGWTQLIPYH